MGIRAGPQVARQRIDFARWRRDGNDELLWVGRGKNLGGTYLYLAAAIASGALFFISGKAAISRKLRISGFQVMIGSIMGPGLVFVLLLVTSMQSVAGLGLWLLGLGFCSIAVGGLVTIGHLANRA